MLDFRTARPVTRNYLARGEQRRLLVLVLLLGAMLLCIGESARPERWQWMWQIGERDSGRLAAVDTRLERPDASAPRHVGPPVPAPAAQAEAPRHEPLPGVDIGALKAEIQDDTKIRPAERPTLYHLLRVLKETDPRTIAAASAGPVTYLQLIEQPQSYRGEVVTIRGRVRRAVDVPTIINEEGLARFFELWITPEDRPSEVLCVETAELPVGLPEGETLDEPVVVHALAVKRMAYQWQNGEWHVAPLLLARSVEWTPAAVAPAVRQAQHWATQYTIGLGLAFALGVAGIAWYSLRRPARPNPYARRAPAPGEEFAKLRELDVAPEAREALRHISPEPVPPPKIDE